MNSTIKVKSTDPASQGPFVVINTADFNADVHVPYDDDSAEALAGAVQSGVIVPPVAELQAGFEQLQARERALADREAELVERESASLIEAQRLADEKAALAAAGTGTPSYATMSKDELQAALTAQGKSFPAAANKADLITLLTSA
jgi:hypothetical protein